MTVLMSRGDRLVPLPENLLWRDRAACRALGAESAEIFFPTPGQSADAAKVVCRSCPVKSECLAFAVEYRCQGVWGETTDEERARLRPERRRASTLTR